MNHPYYFQSLRNQMSRCLKSRLALLAVLAFSSCSTPGAVRIPKLDESIPKIITAIRSTIPVGLRTRSDNGREFFSEYFITSSKRFLPARSAQRRYYAQYIILGDRRPYNIDVVVRIESRAGFLSDGVTQKFSIIGNDEGIARALARKLRVEFNKNVEDKNIVDEFRVF